MAIITRYFKQFSSLQTQLCQILKLDPYCLDRNITQGQGV